MARSPTRFWHSAKPCSTTFPLNVCWNSMIQSRQDYAALCAPRTVTSDSSLGESNSHRMQADLQASHIVDLSESHRRAKHNRGSLKGSSSPCSHTLIRGDLDDLGRHRSHGKRIGPMPNPGSALQPSGFSFSRSESGLFRGELASHRPLLTISSSRLRDIEERTPTH